MLAGLALLPVGAVTWYVLRKRRPRVAVVLLVVGIIVPLYLVPWYFLERIEITKDGVTRFPLNPFARRSLEFDDAQKVQVREYYSSRRDPTPLMCYSAVFFKKDGSDFHWRLDSYLDVAAAEDIWAGFRKRGIPVEIQTIEDQRKQKAIK
jgi:hypothetical protein